MARAVGSVLFRGGTGRSGRLTGRALPGPGLRMVHHPVDRACSGADRVFVSGRRGGLSSRLVGPKRAPWPGCAERPPASAPAGTLEIGPRVGGCERFFGASSTNETLAGPWADPDGDGWSYTGEFAMGLDPQSPDQSVLQGRDDRAGSRSP